MFTIYNLFKFLHVAAAIVWIGGVLTVSVIGARATRTKDRAAQTALARQSSFLGPAMIGPAALTTLIAGIVTAASGRLNFGALWITWGFAGVFASLLLGAVLINRTAGKLGHLTKNAPDDPRLPGLQRRLDALTVINLLVLVSTVWAMVFKPTL